MHKTTNRPRQSTHAALARLEELERIASEASPSLGQSIQGVLNAAHYNDPALIYSAAEEVYSSMRILLERYIESHVGLLTRLEEPLRALRRAAQEDPSENVDESGNVLVGAIDRHLKDCMEADNAGRMLRQVGQDVENMAKLQSEIATFHTLRQKIVENWPWSYAEALPLDKEMVKESREAFARKQEMESIEELLNRLGDSQTSSAE
jgi:hypothetical protein